MNKLEQKIQDTFTEIMFRAQARYETPEDLPIVITDKYMTDGKSPFSLFPYEGKNALKHRYIEINIYDKFNEGYIGDAFAFVVTITPEAELRVKWEWNGDKHDIKANSVDHIFRVINEVENQMLMYMAEREAEERKLDEMAF